MVSHRCHGDQDTISIASFPVFPASFFRLHEVDEKLEGKPGFEATICTNKDISGDNFCDYRS